MSWYTVCSYGTINLGTLLEKIGSLWVMFLTVRYDFSHTYGNIVCRLRDNVWYPIMVSGFNAPILSCSINFIFIVFDSDRVFDTCEISYTRRPYKYCHDVTAANPALIFRTCEESPLGNARNKFFVSQLALNDQLLRLHSWLKQIHIVHTHRLNNVAQFYSLTNVLPLLVRVIFLLKFE